jgi:hypothetical protein
MCKTKVSLTPQDILPASEDDEIQKDDSEDVDPTLMNGEERYIPKLKPDREKAFEPVEGVMWEAAMVKVGRSNATKAELLRAITELFTDKNELRTPLGALHKEELSDIQLVVSHFVPWTTKTEDIVKGEKFLPETVRKTAPVDGMLDGFEDRARGAS